MNTQKTFLDVLIENYEAAKSMVDEDKERPSQETVLETYEDLISIYKANFAQFNSNAGNVWVKASEVDKIEFGDYISVEQKRYVGQNEFYTHKVIGTLKSNTWMDVPAITHAGMTQHNEMEEVVNCICEGVCEEEAIRYRVKDIHSVRKWCQQPIKSDAVDDEKDKIIKLKDKYISELDELLSSRNSEIRHLQNSLNKWKNKTAHQPIAVGDVEKAAETDAKGRGSWSSEIFNQCKYAFKAGAEWQAKQQPLNNK